MGDYYGKPLSAQALSKLLRVHRIKTMPVKVERQTVRGYKIEQFAAAFVELGVVGVTGVTCVTSEAPSHAGGNAGNAGNAYLTNERQLALGYELEDHRAAIADGEDDDW